MLKTLEIRNFRKIESLDITFSSGVNGVFGPNYTGKTTCLMAVAVALGGPSAVRGRNLVNRSATNFFLALEFEAQGDRYRVERTKTDAKLFRQGNLIASKQIQVNAAVSLALGVPVADWLALRFVEQKQASAMFTAGASALNKLLERVTGVQVITHITGLLADVASKAEAVALALKPQTFTDQEYQRLIEQIAALELEILEETAQLESLRVVHPKLLLDLTNIKTELGTVTKLREEALGVATRRTRLAAKLEEKTRALAVAEKAKMEAPAPPSPEDVQALKEKAEDLHRRSRKLAATVSRIEATSTALQRQKAKVTAAEAEAPKETAEDLEAAEKALEDRYEALRGQCQELATQLAGKKAALKLAEEGQHAKTCHACSRPFEDDEASAAAREECRKQAEEVLPAEIRELTKKQHDLTQATDLALRDLRAARERRSAASVAASNLKAAHSLLKEYEAAHTAAELELQAAGGPNALALTEEELKTTQAYLTKVTAEAQTARRAAEDFIVAGAELDKVRQELEELEASSPSVTVEELDVRLDALNTKLREATAAEATAAEQIRTKETARTSRQRELLNVATSVEKHEAAAASLVEAETRAETARGLQKYLRDHKSRYVQSAWALVLGRAGVFAEAATGGRISSLRRTEEGEFEFIEDEFTAQVGDASGAQAAILGLAIQVAMAESMPSHLDLFVCDEPTADMDSDHSTASLLALASACKQTVVISHHRFDETICENLIEL